MKKIILLLLIASGIYFTGNYIVNYQNQKQISLDDEIIHLRDAFSFDLVEKDDQILELEQKLATEKEKQKIYTIIAGGDIMMDRGVEAVINKLNKDYNFLFEKIMTYLHSADYVFANLEGSLSDVGRDQGGKYSFRFEPAVANALSTAGIDIVSLANNHMVDWGRDSLCATVGNLENVGVNSVGAGCDLDRAERMEIVELGNTRVGFLAYTEFHTWAVAGESHPGMSEYNIKKIKERVAAIKNENTADLIFISMHWGEEYLDRAPDRIVNIAHELVDAGVDVIIGHHPHVDQEIERYGKGWIIYSLGNFVFDQSWSANTMEGLLAEIQIQNKRVYDVTPQFIELNSNYQPELVEV